MFDQIFFSPQMKRNVIIGNNYGIFELPHQLLNNLRLRILDKKEKSGKSHKRLELERSAQFYSQKWQKASEK